MAIQCNDNNKVAGVTLYSPLKSKKEGNKGSREEKKRKEWNKKKCETKGLKTTINKRY